MAPVTAVVFDVGRVLVDFRYDAFARILRERGAELSGPEDFLARVDLFGYERGAIGSDDFLAQLNGLMRDPLPREDLVAAWQDLFTPIPEMLELAGKLKAHCGVYLLSNTSELHWQHLKQVYGLEGVCHDLLASYEVGLMKPAGDIYAAAGERFGLEPATTVFVDDREENVSGAIACGWHGVWHRDIPTTKAQLRRLTGVDL